MENMLLVGLSRQMTLEQQLDVVANINTTGFKADRSLFEEYLRSPAHALCFPSFKSTGGNRCPWKQTKPVT